MVGRPCAQEKHSWVRPRARSRRPHSEGSSRSPNMMAPRQALELSVRVTAGGTSFDEALLFTHRGLSGPAVLQASSYWNEGDPISVNLTPGTDLLGALQGHRHSDPRKALTTILSLYLPARLVDYLTEGLALTGTMADQSDARLATICAALADWQVTPSGSEGYRTAEVTLGVSIRTPCHRRQWRPRLCPACISSVNVSMSPDGWAGIIFNGPGHRDGPQARRSGRGKVGLDPPYAPRITHQSD